MNLPNILTLSRIFMIPLMVACFYWPGETGKILAAILFSIAAITDWFDGYLARKLNQSTPLGAFLDPVADKLIVAVALVLLVEHYNTFWISVPASIIICREILVSALREWMAELGKRANVAVSNIGKVKTTFQMISIIVLLGAGLHHWLVYLGYIAIYIASVLTIWSMLLYLKAALPDLLAKE